MPLTLPSHPTAVLPLKLLRPQWFDGVALTVGATAPDVTYPASGYGDTLYSHTLISLLWWTLPMTLIVTRLIRLVAPVVAAHLPAGGRLALRDYGVLGSVRHRWYVTAWSAALGGFSHIAWDAVTHPITPFASLRTEVWTGVPWWYLLVILSDLAGIAAGVALVSHIGQRRLLRRWHGPAPAVTPRPAPFWGTVVAVVAVGLATLGMQPNRDFYAGQAIRVMVIAGIALVCGAIAATVVPALRSREANDR